MLVDNNDQYTQNDSIKPEELVRVWKLLSGSNLSEITTMDKGRSSDWTNVMRTKDSLVREDQKKLGKTSKSQREETDGESSLGF